MKWRARASTPTEKPQEADRAMTSKMTWAALLVLAVTTGGCGTSARKLVPQCNAVVEVINPVVYKAAALTTLRLDQREHSRSRLKVIRDDMRDAARKLRDLELSDAPLSAHAESYAALFSELAEQADTLRDVMAEMPAEADVTEELLADPTSAPSRLNSALKQTESILSRESALKDKVAERCTPG